jgi:hypothetical protein
LGWPSEFKSALGRCLAVQGEMGSLLVALFLPSLKFARQVLATPELLSVRKLLLVSLKAAFDLTVDLGAGGRDVAESDAEIGQAQVNYGPDE